MTTIGQHNPKLDDTVYVYVDNSGVVNRSTSILSSSVVVAIFNPPIYGVSFYLLAWKNNSHIPANTLSINNVSFSSNNVSKSTHLSTYIAFLWMPDNHEIYIPQAQSAANPSGMHLCTQCKALWTSNANSVCVACASTPISGQAITLPSMPVAKAHIDPYAIGQASVSMVKEKPCFVRTCGKMNDIGVGKCWNCETPNPTPR